MSNLFKGVDAKTRMVGENRMELLLFQLGDHQRFGINVFKVREVVVCPPLTRPPGSHPKIKGMATIRGQTISIVDLATAIDKKNPYDIDDCKVIVSENSFGTYGFLVSGVERIVNLDWETIKTPPSGLGRANYLTAIVNVEDEIVEILDIEKLIMEFIRVERESSEHNVSDEIASRLKDKHVLVVDDSSMARNLICKCVERLGLKYVTANTGREALDILEGWVNEPGLDLSKYCNLVITDVEMPDMDGYSLTKTIKNDERLQSLPVLLHSSLKGAFNRTIMDNIKADGFLEKFNPDELSKYIVMLTEGINEDDPLKRVASA